MLSISDNNQADVVEAFNSTSGYLDDLFNIDNPYYLLMVSQIYPTELQLNKTNSSDTEAPFLDLNLSITNGIVSSKIMINGMVLTLKYLIFHFLMAMLLLPPPSFGVYTPQLSYFVRVCSNVMTSTTETNFCRFITY